MARIPESEIEQLKLQVSLERLVESAGVVLKGHGKDRIGLCPLHPDKSPSLVVSPKSNLWHCLGACQAGGSVIDWVMRLEKVSFRRAVEILRREIGVAETNAVGRVESRTVDARAPARASAMCPTAPHRDVQVSQAQDAQERPPGMDAQASPSLHAVALSNDDQALLRHVIDYYHTTLLQSPEAKAYLDARGIYAIEAIAAFKLGFADRTLAYQVPPMQNKAGATLRGALQRTGLYRESGHEHFNGSLVIPVIDIDGEVTEVYGRKITKGLRPGTPLHLYLPGPHRGVFNAQGLIGQEEVILCEALIDALTFWCAGYRNVTSSYGIEGFTPDLLDALKRHGIKRVLIAYDADDAGNGAAEKLAIRLMSEGFECYRCRFPKGMDANEYALAVKPAIKSLGVVIRQAEWLGKAAPSSLRPTSTSRLEICPNDVADVQREADAVFADRSDASSAVLAFSASASAGVLPLVAVLALAAPAHPAPAAFAHPCAAEATAEEESNGSGASPALRPKEVPLGQEQRPDAGECGFVPAHRVPPSAPLLPVEIDDKELRLVLGDRAYTVRGIEKNLSYEQLRVWLRVSRGDFVQIDTVELYQAKQRQAWLKAASVELGTSEDVLKGDIGKLLRVIEQRQDEIIRRQLKPTNEERAAAPLSPAQHDAAMALLRDPRLVDRIIADVETTGVVGESSNALVAYLACVSRKLDKPLAILIQSTSAAGKSTLMDALLALMPESERVHYSAMTGQSLFYLGETSMKHKILAIAEEEGVRQAAYALKVLQSQGELTIASTGKDPTTGDLQTKTYTVEGPVMLFLTTTAIDIDEELLNRCLVLTINESREQTAAIQVKQRTSRTLAGLLTKAHCDEVLATHRAAQQLLLPLAVVNPFAEQLTFASDRVRLRRDHQKYLALIDSIALLHQHQRPIRNATHGGKEIAYIEVTLDDIALANRLAHEVLGRSLDELPPQTRRLLGQVQAFVAKRATAQAIEHSLVRFMRRELRDYTSMSDTQMRVHLDRLVTLEYLVPHGGRNGQRFVYELVFDGDVTSDAPQAIGLRSVEDVGDTITMSHFAGVNANLAASERNLAGRLRPASGHLTATSRGEETPHSPRSDAVLSSLVAAVDQTALLEEKKVPRRSSRSNGASYAGDTTAAHAIAATAKNR